MPEILQTDPRAGYLQYRGEIDAAIERVLAGGWYIMGAEVAAFEQEFAAYVGPRHAIGVGSGTDALELSLRSCGIGAGDLVFTVSHTAVATVAAIESAGAIPVLIDIDPEMYTMDAQLLEIAIINASGGTPKAVIPVHLYGNPCDMTLINAVAERHGLRVVEDCAQSHGATLLGRMTGAWGHVAAFSFYPTKNLGTFGDGGMIVTDDPAIAENARLLQQYGWKERYVSEIPGKNSRLDELHAAILRVKLRHLDANNGRRRDIAESYTALLSDADIRLPKASAGAEHVFHQFVIRAPERDALRAHLRDAGIGSLVHYPVPVHLQPAYSSRLPPPAKLSNTELAAGQILSLPMYPQLTDEQVGRVAEAVIDFRREGTR
ncbi:MAG: DegT/DnrJ/EryC1/StrS family aminotransferase [Gemmatimonadales bacterium]